MLSAMNSCVFVLFTCLMGNTMGARDDWGEPDANHHNVKSFERSTGRALPVHAALEATTAHMHETEGETEERGMRDTHLNPHNGGIRLWLSRKLGPAAEKTHSLLQNTALKAASTLGVTLGVIAVLAVTVTMAIIGYLFRSHLGFGVSEQAPPRQSMQPPPSLENTNRLALEAFKRSHTLEVDDDDLMNNLTPSFSKMTAVPEARESQVLALAADERRVSLANAPSETEVASDPTETPEPAAPSIAEEEGPTPPPDSLAKFKKAVNKLTAFSALAAQGPAAYLTHNNTNQGTLTLVWSRTAVQDPLAILIPRKEIPSHKMKTNQGRVDMARQANLTVHKNKYYEGVCHFVKASYGFDCTLIMCTEAVLVHLREPSGKLVDVKTGTEYDLTKYDAVLCGGTATTSLIEVKALPVVTFKSGK